MPFALAEHVYAAEFVDQTVLLDTRGSRYLSIAGSLAAMTDVESAMAPDGDTRPVVKALQRRGYLREGRYGTNSSLSRPVRDLNPVCPPGYRVLTPALVVILAAQHAMARRLRAASIEQVVDELRRMKQRRQQRATTSDPAAVARFVALFRQSHHFISAQDRCLMKAICLFRGLLRYCGDVQLALGVRPGPFSAHAWVQHGDCVLGDDVERVRLFTPILVV